MSRTGRVERETKETNILVALEVDGGGVAEIATGIPFFDHMLELFARHGLFDITVKAAGDLEIDAHHTVEDVGICLGDAFKKALAEKRGLNRYGDALMPMDETLVAAAVDISGRPHLVYEVDLPIELIGTYDTSLTEEFLRAFVNKAGLTLHIRLMRGGNPHHVVEAVFKGLARALLEACQINPRVGDVPSTKGTL